jgi:hypothetical protein
MTNPNGANGTTGDPREELCWKFYIESVIANKENAYQSAIDAGYSNDHSRNITMQGWFKERKAKLKRKEMFTKAEKKLDQLIDSEDERVAADVSKFIAKTLGKDEGYSERTETTGKDGGPVGVIILPQKNGDKMGTNTETNRSVDQE